jgi:hypothetical protein
VPASAAIGSERLGGADRRLVVIGGGRVALPAVRGRCRFRQLRFGRLALRELRVRRGGIGERGGLPHEHRLAVVRRVPRDGVGLVRRAVQLPRRHRLGRKLAGRVRIHRERLGREGLGREGLVAQRVVAADHRERRHVLAAVRPVVARRLVARDPDLGAAELRVRLVDPQRHRLVHLADERVAAGDDDERCVVVARGDRREELGRLGRCVAHPVGRRPGRLVARRGDDRERLVERVVQRRAALVGGELAVGRRARRRRERLVRGGRVVDVEARRRERRHRRLVERCVHERGRRLRRLDRAGRRGEQVEGAEERRDLRIARIRVEHPGVPAACVVEVAGRAVDVAHLPEGDHVLGIEVERRLEERAGLVTRARLVQRLAEHDLPAHVIGLLRQLLAADGDGAVEVPRPPVLVGERGEIAARVLFEFPLQLVDPGGASQCKSPEKRHGAPLEAGGRTWQHTARTFGKSIGELTLSLDFRGRPPLPCWALAGPFFLVHL